MTLCCEGMAVTAALEAELSSRQLFSFKLSSGYLFNPHHVNQGAVQKPTPQVTLYEPHTAEESVGHRNDVAALHMATDLTRCSQVTILL